MRVIVVSHKECWVDPTSSSGYATDGGFPFQMAALSELFDAITLVLPVSQRHKQNGVMPLEGHRLTVTPLTSPPGKGIWRKVGFPFWLLRNSPVLLRQLHRADAVHAPIPGDVGTVGMLLAVAFGKPLFVRHCGNWLVQRTVNGGLHDTEAA